MLSMVAFSWRGTEAFPSKYNPIFISDGAERTSRKPREKTTHDRKDDEKDALARNYNDIVIQVFYILSA
jgi:hypothetical protein